MDHVAPGGRFLLRGARGRRVGVAGVLGGIALGAACTACGASSEREPAIGSSSGPSVAEGAPGGNGGDAGPPLVTPVPADFRVSMTRVTPAPFVSKGHAGGRWSAVVYADPSGVDALRGDRTAVPVGARFVEEHFEQNDAGAGPIMMMKKEAPGFDPERGNWRYVVVGTKGELVKDGVVESCAGCHGEAPGDHLFRVVPAP